MHRHHAADGLELVALARGFKRHDDADPAEAVAALNKRLREVITLADYGLEMSKPADAHALMHAIKQKHGNP